MTELINKWLVIQTTIENMEKNYELLKQEKANLEKIQSKIQTTELKTRIENNLANFKQATQVLIQTRQKAEQLEAHLKNTLSQSDYEQLIKSKKAK